MPAFGDKLGPDDIEDRAWHMANDALVTYGKYDVGAIITQVTNGNGSMPAFGDKLGPDDIEDCSGSGIS
eukprot:s6254_g1.t1